MKRYDKTTTLPPEVAQAVQEIADGLGEATTLALAGLKSTYAALDKVIATVLPFLDYVLQVPDQRGLRCAMPQQALLEFYRGRGYRVSAGANPFLPAVKIVFAQCDTSSTALSQYALLVAASIERFGGKLATELKKTYGPMGDVIDLWKAAGGGYTRTGRKNEDHDDGHDGDPPSDIAEAIAECERLTSELELEKRQGTLLAENASLVNDELKAERAQRLAAEKRAVEAEALAEDYRAKWEAAAAELAELREQAERVVAVFERSKLAKHDVVDDAD